MDMLNLVIDERFKHIETQFILRDKADILAAKVLEARLEALNHLRQEFVDQRQSSVNVAEYRVAHEALREQIAKMSTELSENRGKASMASVMFAYGLAVLNLVLAVAAFYHK